MEYRGRDFDMFTILSYNEQVEFIGEKLYANTKSYKFSSHFIKKWLFLFFLKKFSKIMNLADGMRSSRGIKAIGKKMQVKKAG